VSDIVTERLILRTVPLAGLRATADGDRDTAARLIGRRLPEEWFADAWVHGLRFAQWSADPGYGPWSIRAIAEKSTGQIVGNMNCHHSPMPFVLDGETLLAVEAGYTIFTDWRRRGYAAEMLAGFIAWAKSQGVAGLVLSIAPGNLASRALAARFGARQIGSQIDETDGPEDIFFVRFQK
jgi:RimJ/RimL family protein N-acetyltransferase